MPRAKKEEKVDGSPRIGQGSPVNTERGTTRDTNESNIKDSLSTDTDQQIQQFLDGKEMYNLPPKPADPEKWVNALLAFVDMSPIEEQHKQLLQRIIGGMHTLNQAMISSAVRGSALLHQNPSTVMPPPSDSAFTRSIIVMAIHLLGGREIKQQVAKLDTGAELNLISRPFASSLGLHVEDYQGNSVVTIGEQGPFRPEGMISLDWNVSGKPLRYTSQFAVLDERQCQGSFDVLLGEDEIKKIGFFIKNNAVWSIRFERL
ncbi:MAG: hypothetical protein LQ352_005962 [Teloschistes flavicans]|nr:MAG: hypothetical protein LQ352_005962 [Teloschistes flavicans]